MATYLGAGTVVTRANKGRLAAQSEVARNTVLMASLAGLGSALALSSFLLKRRTAGDPTEGGTGAHPGTVEAGSRRLWRLQSATATVTGGMLVVNARLGELQRPKEIAAGMWSRLRGRW